MMNNSLLFACVPSCVTYKNHEDYNVKKEELRFFEIYLEKNETKKIENIFSSAIVIEKGEKNNHILYTLQHNLTFNYRFVTHNKPEFEIKKFFFLFLHFFKSSVVYLLSSIIIMMSLRFRM